MDNMKPYLILQSIIAENLEVYVADWMTKGYIAQGGISIAWCESSVCYVQAMVFTGKPKVEAVDDAVPTDPMAKVFSPVIFKLLKDNKITTLESLTRLSPRQLMLKSPHFTHQVIARIQASLLEVGLRLPFEL